MPHSSLRLRFSWFKTTFFKRFVLLLPCAIGLILLPAVDAQEFVLKPNETQRWYRGNMHTHSLWSDGDNYPEMIAFWYRNQGYQFVVFTDHNTLHNREQWLDIEMNKGGRKAYENYRLSFPGQWVQTREKNGREQVRLKEFDAVYKRFSRPEKFLVIQGEEITDAFRRHPIHMCATNVTSMVPPMTGESVVDVMQRNFDAVRSSAERNGTRTLVHVNHPNFGYAITAEQLMQVEGEHFFEVYNGHSGVNNSGDEVHASTEKQWDIINTWRRSKLGFPLMYGLATDDSHDYFLKTPQKGSQPGRGWVVVLARFLKPEALVDSLEAGRFYSSSGVKLKSIERTTDNLIVKVDAEKDVTYRIDFIGTRESFDDSSSPASEDPKIAAKTTRRYSDDVGMVFQSSEGPDASYAFEGTELYVRAVVTSSRLHANPSQPGEFQRAWVQPVIVAGGEEVQ